MSAASDIAKLRTNITHEQFTDTTSIVWLPIFLRPKNLEIIGMDWICLPPSDNSIVASKPEQVRESNSTWLSFKEGKLTKKIIVCRKDVRERCCESENWRYGRSF